MLACSNVVNSGIRLERRLQAAADTIDASTSIVLADIGDMDRTFYEAGQQPGRSLVAAR